MLFRSTSGECIKLRRDRIIEFGGGARLEGESQANGAPPLLHSGAGEEIKEFYADRQWNGLFRKGHKITHRHSSRGGERNISLDWGSCRRKLDATNSWLTSAQPLHRNLGHEDARRLSPLWGGWVKFTNEPGNSITCNARRSTRMEKR